MGIFPRTFKGPFSDCTISENNVTSKEPGIIVICHVPVIVNDMSEVNIDAELVKKEGGLSRTEEKLVELSNGCICCTLCEDLRLEVKKLAEQGEFDYILIESTGISEPVPEKTTRVIFRTC